MAKAKHARRGTKAWRQESAAAIPPASDEAVKQLEQDALTGLGHEHINYDFCCTFDDDLARKVLALINRVRQPAA